MNPFNGFDFAIDNEFEDIVLVAQLTSDSHIIVIFDSRNTSTITTNSSVVVSEMTLEQIQSLEIGYWVNPKSAYRFHALTDVLERYKDKLRFHLEIKSEEDEGLVSRICELVREFDARDAVTIQSFWKLYPVSISWTKRPDCLREIFSSSLPERINDEYKESNTKRQC